MAIHRLLLVALAVLVTESSAGEVLTLSQALSYADSGHPELILADAELALAVAERQQVDASHALEAYFELAPVTAMPTSRDEFINDSYLSLSLSKTLYDFGYSKTRADSAEQSILSKQLMAQDIRNKNHLKIMQLYFDVVLADLHFAALNEQMATLFVEFDKQRDRHSLGMLSDDTLAAAENLYREVADVRKRSEMEQRDSRLRLAMALNRPDDIATDVQRPDLPQLQLPLPETDALLNTALENNLMLTALEHAVLADKAALKAAQQQFGPTLAAAVELTEYQRRLASRNNASVGVLLRVPLSSGSRSQAESARIAAQLSASQAHYEQAKYTLREQLSALVNRLELLYYQRQTDAQRLDSTALNLEKSRGRYELEMQTTLGNSMAKFTEAEWLSAKNDFAIATTWTHIELLTGKKLYQAAENYSELY